MSYRKPASKNKKRSAKRRKRRLKPWVIPAAIALIVVIILIIVISVVAGNASKKGNGKDDPKQASAASESMSQEGESEEAESEPLVPEIISSIRVGATGDILIHPSVLAAFDTGDGHDFHGAFSFVAPYYSELDLMVANLEVPLVDPADGYEYSSNPFASPDAVAEALKDSGVDVCLTANNHTYDMGSYGLIRTQNVLDRVGIEYTGTRKSTDQSYILAKEVGKVKLGMICYTYETGGGADYDKSLNYIPLYGDNANLVNTFNYYDLETFYADAKKQLSAMDALGCDVKIFYLHWGDEYQDNPNEDQLDIAEKLAELGVDVIVGGHPHVVQKFDVIKRADGHETLCLYSMGNELSNQRREYMNEDDFRGYTEDGVVFIITIDKYNTGEAVISAVDVLPTWVQRDDSFEIIPLDPALDEYSWPAYDTELAVESYNRTMGRLGDAYFAFRDAHGQSEISASRW